MTPREFKAWFEGFTEAFGPKIPTKVQWLRIKERIGEIDGQPITERVFVDRWYPYIHQYYPSKWTYMTTGEVPQNALQCSLVYDSAIAMNEVGRSEAAALS